MIYSPELVRLLASLVERGIEVLRRHPLLPLKLAAVSFAVTTLPFFFATNPVTGTAVAAATVPAAIATAEEVRQAATEVSPEGVAALTSATEKVVRELDRVVKEGGVLMEVPPPAPLPPTKGLTNALDEAAAK